MSSNKGIKSFKERKVASIVKEYTQLDDMNVVETGNPNVFTPEQKRK